MTREKETFLAIQKTARIVGDIVAVKAGDGIELNLGTGCRSR